MTLKLASLTLLIALNTAAFPQTAPQTPAQKTAPAAPHSASPAHTPARTTAASRIPRVPGIPKTLYALKYIDTKIGTGALAEQHKFYSVRYTGWLKDGIKFDSSYDHPGGEPITFPYGAHRVIPGWDTGFEGMHVGGKRRLLIPYQLAYGDAGRPPVIPAKSDLTFDIELVAQSDTPPAPKQTATPPPGAQQPKPSSAPPAGTPNPQPKPSEAAPDSTAKPAPPSSPVTAAPQPTPAPQPAPTPQPQTPPHPESR